MKLILCLTELGKSGDPFDPDK